MTLTNEGRPHSFVRTNHSSICYQAHDWSTYPALRHTDYLTMDNICECVCVVNLLWDFTSSFTSREYSRYDEFLTSVAISHIWKKKPLSPSLPQEISNNPPCQSCCQKHDKLVPFNKKMGKNFHICQALAIICKGRVIQVIHMVQVVQVIKVVQVV